jgi:hypothetical protein
LIRFPRGSELPPAVLKTASMGRERALSPADLVASGA